jgi:hypothetical protein
MVLSHDPDAIVLPSGENVIADTTSEWPFSSHICLPVSLSQRRIVRSPEHAAIIFPLGEKATELTGPPKVPSTVPDILGFFHASIVRRWNSHNAISHHERLDVRLI